MFLISPRFKEPLLHELERLNYTVDFSQYKYVLIKGNQVTVMGVLVHCLTAIDCDAVRIRVYNLKAPIRLLSELYTFHSSHPLRFTNFFDVGVTEKQDIAGLSLLKGVGPLTKTFPICSPAAKGYGTVRLQTKISHKFVNALALEHQIVETKMYSKVAHVIRSIGVKPSLFNARTVMVMKGRYNSAKGTFDKICNKPDDVLQGFRIEATIRATNLTWALEIALIHRLLDSQTYDQRYELTELPRSAYIANAQRLISKVQDFNLLKGSSSAKASNEKNKVEADVWQSVGWNNSRRKLTKHNDVNAWWNDHITNREFEKSIRFVSDVFFSETANCKAFFMFVKSRLKCPNCDGIDTFNVGGRTKNFTMKCGNCSERMGKKKSTIMWNELLNGEDKEYFQDAIEATREANCSPRPTSPVRRDSFNSSSCPSDLGSCTSDSSSCPSLYDTSPEPRKRFIAETSSEDSADSICQSSHCSPGSSCSSIHDSPEPPHKKFIVERDSDNLSRSFDAPETHRDRSVIEINSDSPSYPFDTPERDRERSVIEISSDSSEGSPELRKRMFLEVESSQSHVPESVESNSAGSHQCAQSEGEVEAPTNAPAQATSIEQVNDEMQEGPKYMVRTFWKNILDSNFPEGAVHHQIPNHYIRTDGYIVGDGNCMFRAISFALYDDQEKHDDIRKLVVDYMAKNIEGRVGQENAEMLDCSTWVDYLRKMRKEGTHGDEYVLINAALACRTNIVVLSTSGSTKSIKTFRYRGEQLIAICHVNGNHYEALRGTK
ncbi:hypothetical protein E3Q23_04450 [Wallemia mellicola]|nr:hypothetical protein E3Q23_04450 [Wallemia mellicola]